MKKITVVLICILLLSCEKEVSQTSTATWTVDESESSLAVETLTVTEGDIYPEIKSAGVISGIREANIISETMGIIKEVNFEIGDIINTNQVLLKVDDTIAKLTMEQAKQQNDSAQLDLKSIQSFYDKGTASLSELTRARSSANGAKALYETTLKAFNDSSIKSPISGAVAWKESTITRGNYINQGSSIARVVDMSAIRVKLSVGERQIGLITLGADALIKIPSIYNSEPIKGKVVAIAAGSDLSTGSYSVIVEGENIYPNILKAGMSSSVIIDTTSENREIIIPTDSIVIRDNSNYVFINKLGIAEPVEVVIGKTVGNRAVILEGLDIDTEIIISGLTTIKPGAKINPTNLGDSGDTL